VRLHVALAGQRLVTLAGGAYAPLDEQHDGRGVRFGHPVPLEHCGRRCLDWSLRP
jgi:hypothetical protein